MYDEHGVYRFEDAQVDMLDSIRANVINLMVEDDDLNVSYILERIFKDIEGLRIRLNDLEKERHEFRRREIRAKLDLEDYKRQHPELEKEE